MRLKGGTSTARGENMAEEGEGGAEGFLASIQAELKAKTYRASPGFSGHWLTIQPSLFPEWEREMDRKACEEWERRLPSIAAPSVLPRDAAKFHGLRDADEKPLVVPLRTQGEI